MTPGNPTSFGQLLKREREMRGVSLSEIAAKTRIGVRFLDAIEKDQWDKLPAGVFPRAFVREYARELGLDEKKVLTDLAFYTGFKPTHVEREAPQREQSLQHSAVSGAAFAVVVSAVGLLIVAPALRRQAVDPGLAAAPAPLVAPVQVASVEPVPPHAATQPAAAEPVKLTLTATEDCWIGLDMGGDRVVNQILKKGESFSIDATEDATLAVGNAGGLLIAFGGGPPRPLGARGEVKRRIPLSPASLSVLTAGAAPGPVGL